MKILAVADYRTPLASELPGRGRFAGVELILSCGDLPQDYLASLVRAFGAPLFYVRGNHDLLLRADSPPGCTDIHGRVVSLNGICIGGLEGCHWYNGGPFQYTESQMRRVVRGLGPAARRRGGLDIAIAHAAPRGVRDAEDPCHRGFQAFHALIERYRPRYFLHGHIHGVFPTPGERISDVDSTKVVNCSGYYLFEIQEAGRG